MKYGLQKGTGEYTFHGTQVAVVRFQTSAELREWVAARRGREGISAKKYVKAGDRNVSVRSAAITAKELAALFDTRVRVPLRPEVENQW